MLDFLSKIGETARKFTAPTRETRALTIYFIEIRKIIVPKLTERRQ